MSTTYYWYRPRQLDQLTFDAWVGDCRAIIERAKSDQEGQPVIIRGTEGTGEPVTSSSLVALNGDAATGHDFEPFVVSRLMPKTQRDRADAEGRVFSFCKVAGRPYERVVAACLAALELRFGDQVRIEVDALGVPRMEQSREQAKLRNRYM